MKKLMLLLALMVVCTFKAKSQPIAGWNCNNTLSNTYQDLDMVYPVSPITANGVSQDPFNPFPNGCPGPAPDRGASWRNWPLSPAPDLSKYVEISITAYQDILLQELQISTRRAGVGPLRWQVRWSIDGYTSTIYSNSVSADDSVSTSCVYHSINLWLSPVNTGQTVSFRFYASEASTTAGIWVHDDLMIYASAISPLPITLTSFTGEVSGNASVLRWTTASEQDNSHFTIFRSGNGDDWSDVGRISGAGTSLHSIDYWFVDQNPLAGINYYRLRQTDFDGTFEESWMVVVKHKDRPPGVIHHIGDIASISGERSTLIGLSGSIISPLGEKHHIGNHGVFTLVGEYGTVIRILVQ